MVDRDKIISSLPEINKIENKELREQVLETYEIAINNSRFDDITELPWWPPFEKELNQNINQQSHVRDVVNFALAITNELESRRPNININKDYVIAGALVHDISKFWEMSEREMSDLIPHPYYSVHLLAETEMPAEIIHIALSHSSRTSIEPKSIESQIVQYADKVSTNAIFWEYTNGKRLSSSE